MQRVCDVELNVLLVMYVCMYVHMYIHMYICVCVCNSPMYVCIFVWKGFAGIVLTHISDSDSDLRMRVVKSSTSQLRAAFLTPSTTFGGWSGRKTVV